jgi:glycosyltransferase involved in cell wall biosynthesis
MTHKITNIGILFPSPLEWMGGANYYFRLITLLNEKSRVIRCTVFMEPSIDRELYLEVKALPNVDVVIISSVKQSKNGLFTSIFMCKDGHFEALFTKHKVDLVFSNATFFGWRFNIPTVSWIPDLQHAYLPEMFSMTVKMKRDIGFLFQGCFSKAVVFSSFDAKNAFVKRYWHRKTKLHVVRFSVKAPVVNNKLTAEIKKKYDINTEYVFLPNQYWSHKNHKVVIDALVFLKNNERIGYRIVSTGNTSSTAYDDFIDYVNKNNISNAEYLSLGLVPREDVESLMAGAAFVLNPSLFEGWSTSVEEAKSLCKNLILSDIPIHREQAKIGAQFFSPKDAVELSHLLSFENKIGSSSMFESSEKLQKRFYDEFIKVINLSV